MRVVGGGSRGGAILAAAGIKVGTNSRGLV